MAQTITGIGKAKILNQLDTYNHTAMLNSMYMVSISLSELPPSGMSIVIQQNAVTKASVSSPAISQNHMDLQIVLNCAINDVISVILSSSNVNDKQLNSIRGTLNIHTGSF